MKLICPSCAATHSVDAWLSDSDARDCILIVASLPADLGPLVLRYVSLFRPAKRALAWPRVKRLLQELVQLIQAGKISRKGRDWPAPLSAWQHGIEYVLQRRDQGRLTTPLDSHGYLLEVLAGEADKAEAKDERNRERQRGDRRDGDAWDSPARAQPAPAAPAATGVNWVQHAFATYLDHCANRWQIQPTFEGLTNELQGGRKQMGLPPMRAPELQEWFKRAEQKIGKPLVHTSGAAETGAISEMARSFGRIEPTNDRGSSGS